MAIMIGIIMGIIMGIMEKHGKTLSVLIVGDEILKIIMVQNVG